MNRLFSTLSARLAFWYALVFVFFSGIALLIFYLSIDNILREDLDEDLEEDVSEMQSYLEEGGFDNIKKEILREIASDDPNEIFIRIVDLKGNIVFTTDTSSWMYMADNLSDVTDMLEDDGVAFKSLMIDDDMKARMISANISEEFFIQIAATTEDIDEFVSFILRLFIITYFIVTVMAVLVGWYIAKRALSGVEAVSNAAVDVINGSMNRRVDIKPQGEEVEKLVSKFNMMLDRIRELVIGMREMTDNIAHDLRSQLGRIRANAEMSLSESATLDDQKKSAADIIEECDRLLHLINTTLEVSEAEFGLSQLAMHRVNISEIITDAYELFEPIAEQKGVALDLNAEPNCYLNGHTQYLQRMLANFIDNALKYTLPEGRVGLDLVSDNKEVKITIRDTGIGVSRNNQSRIFDRFFRCEESRTTNGTGLGLSFARAVVLAHGGSISLSSELNEGSVFTVRIPANFDLNYV